VLYIYVPSPKGKYSLSYKISEIAFPEFQPLQDALFLVFFIFFKILQALSQQEYMSNNNNYICNITNVTGNHNSFRPITVTPK
jgi:hypothetical protein